MKNIQDVIKEFPSTCTERYDFTAAVYTGALERIQGVQCPAHGVFSQYAAQFRKGKGCPQCGHDARGATRSANAGDFFSRAAALHEGRYIYPEQPFTNMQQKVQVECPAHGVFPITALKHLYDGQGCPECAKKTRGHRKDVATASKKTAASKVQQFAFKFAEQAVAVHGEQYDYSAVAYAGARTKVAIICKEHGTFWQTPEHHLKRMQGCPHCSHHVSKAEDVIFKLLSNYTSAVQRDRTVVAPRELDIYLPEIRLAVEYCGMYWHSSFTKAEEATMRSRHVDKHVACAAKGVRLITVYEAEWNAHRYAIQRLLRNAAGKSRGRLMARKCDMQSVPAADAKVFYDRYHPQGGAGSGEHYGLYWKGKLVACMRFALGQNDRGAAASNREWTLGRFATRIPVAGAASKLLQAFIAEHAPKSIKSFSDSRYFDGGMYAKLGFVLDAELPPDYQVWSQKRGLLPKTAYQRRYLAMRMAEHGMAGGFDADSDSRTETEMTYAMGAGRIHDCGKKRWVWTATV